MGSLSANSMLSIEQHMHNIWASLWSTHQHTQKLTRFTWLSPIIRLNCRVCGKWRFHIHPTTACTPTCTSMVTVLCLQTMNLVLTNLLFVPLCSFPNSHCLRIEAYISTVYTKSVFQLFWSLRMSRQAKLMTPALPECNCRHLSR